MSVAKTFYGVADCHGLEYFVEAGVDLPLGFFVLRAGLNSHRHAVAFLATVFAADADHIYKALGQGPTEGLRALQMRAASVKVTEDGAKLWQTIPDASLDPYSQKGIQEAMRRGEEFPAPVLLKQAGGVQPIDGVRRLRAAEACGEKKFGGYLIEESGLPKGKFERELQGSV